MGAPKPPKVKISIALYCKQNSFLMVVLFSVKYQRLNTAHDSRSFNFIYQFQLKLSIYLIYTTLLTIFTSVQMSKESIGEWFIDLLIQKIPLAK